MTYHVQTEDKGLKNPIILSLVYVGGTILASKRTPYTDLVASGYDEKSLAERLNRQHKLICAAIRAGRVEDLKKMNEAPREGAPAPEQTPAVEAPAPTVPSPVAAPPPVVAPPPPPVAVPEPAAPVYAARPAASILDLITDASVPIVPEGIVVPRAEFEPARMPTPEAPPPPEPEPEVVVSAPDAGDAEDLYLNLLDDEGDFRAGQLATIKIYVGRGTLGRRAVAEAGVTVKVLGTTFRPLILSTRTGADGVAVVRALLPQFNSGRAAILIRAADANGGEAELRRIIHQS